MFKYRQNTQIRKRQIVAAARRLIIKRGSEHVTVRQITKEIGVSEGNIYRHFKSKSDILSFSVFSKAAGQSRMFFAEPSINQK